MSWLIYKHTLRAECPHYGWSYIGQTCQEPEKRWGSNGNGYTGSHTQNGQLVVFAKAIEEYGWENFSHEILEEDIKTFEEASLREQYWINFYHTYVNDPDCAGYNMTRGGGGSFGYKHSEETKALIKQRVKQAFPEGRFGENHPMYGKHHSEETLRKLSEYGRKNPVNYWKGKARSEETKEKLRQANLGKKLTAEQKEIFAQKCRNTRLCNGTDVVNCIKIDQFSLEGNFIKTWSKLVDAAKALHIPPGNITKVCQGIRKSAGGFKWQYVDK